VQPTATPTGTPWSTATPVAPLPPAVDTPVVLTPDTPTAVNPFASPTPDAPHDLPEMRTEPVEYTVQAGDTMAKIAQHFDVTIEEIVKENGVDPAAMQVGQKLTIPVHPPSPRAAFKIIPDSEAVYSPSSVD
jgi:LysM repeat protein